MMLQLRSTLDAGVTDLTHLRGIELLPGTVVELAVEVFNELCVDEVQKSVTYVTVVLDRGREYVVVDGQVEEVEFLLVVFLKSF